MKPCTVCRDQMRTEYHGRTKLYCSNTCAQVASVLRRTTPEVILRLRPDVRQVALREDENG